MIELYTWPTPNGWKVHIALEEMGIAYNVHPIDIMSNVQKEAAFLSINPNGRIPAIVDTAEDLTIFESGAIMIHLGEASGQFLPSNKRARAHVLQWLMFQMSGIGPMMGQANIFSRYFPEKIPAAIERFHSEVRRLFGVLDGHLNDHEFLADEYSIADMANWSWVCCHFWSGVEIDAFENLQRWIKAIESRPAVEAGVNLIDRSNYDLLTGRSGDPEAMAKEAFDLVQTGTK